MSYSPAKFNKEDRVKLNLKDLDTPPMYWHTGDTGVVVKASPTQVIVRMDRQSAFAVSWHPSHLELVQEEARVLPTDGELRKQYPLWDGLFAYFPAALCEVARWSKKGNDQHNPGEPLHWAREKSTDHENKILRHLLDARHVDEDGFIEAVALAWRSLALCQTILEERGWPEGANAKRISSV